MLSVTPGPLPLRAVAPPGKRVSLGVIRSKENVSYEWSHRRGEPEPVAGGTAPGAAAAPEEAPEVFEQVSDEQGARPRDLTLLRPPRLRRSPQPALPPAPPRFRAAAGVRLIQRITRRVKDPDEVQFTLNNTKRIAVKVTVDLEGGEFVDFGTLGRPIVAVVPGGVRTRAAPSQTPLRPDLHADAAAGAALLRGWSRPRVRRSSARSSSWAA